MDQPLISVIVTTYNYAHTVGTAIESALAQDYPNLEVVVVDNASTDATPALMERYASDPRVRSIRNATNIGMVPNHNKGLIEARGAYVLFLSADDFLLPGHLTRSYAYLVAHPDVDVLYTTTYFVNEAGRFIGVRQMSGQPLVPYDGGRNEFAALLTEGCYMCFPTMLMRRDLYDRFGLLDEAIKAADYEIVVRWAANGVRFGYVPEATCAVRLHDNQQSSAQNYVADAGDIREFIYLIKKFAAPFGERLRGYESAISRHLWGRYQMALGAGVTDADGSIRAQLLECDAILASVRTANAAAPRTYEPTIIVLGSQHIGAMERTFRSLIAQTHAGWNAIVIEQTGYSCGALASVLDPAGRLRTYRPLGGTSEAAALNAALRIATGNVFFVVRGGNEFAPDHLARVLAVMADSHVEGVRSAVRLAIDGAGEGAIYDVFMPPAESRAPWIAPFGPIESFAFTRAALELIAYNEQLPAFAEWDLFLRIAMTTPIAASDDVGAMVHVGNGTADAFARFAQLPAIAAAVHQTFRSDDPAIAVDRDAFLRRIESALALGPAASSSVDGIVRLFAAASGGELVAGVR
jgi:glycosyltransferase involved in cell wall biosynthesis